MSDLRQTERRVVASAARAQSYPVSVQEVARVIQLPATPVHDAAGSHDAERPAWVSSKLGVHGRRNG